MNDDAHRFRVGHFECTAVSDGTFTYAAPTFPPPATLLFANASGDALDAAGRSHKLQTRDWREKTSK